MRNFHTGRRDGTPRGIPDKRMLDNSKVRCLNPSLIPSPTDAVRMYMSHGGQLTMHSGFGLDPLRTNAGKHRLRLQSFLQICPPFEIIFSETVNGNSDIFKRNLLIFIDITRRLQLPCT